MFRTGRTGLLITGDAQGGVRAVQMTQSEFHWISATRFHSSLQ